MRFDKKKALYIHNRTINCGSEALTRPSEGQCRGTKRRCRGVKGRYRGTKGQLFTFLS